VPEQRLLAGADDRRTDKPRPPADRATRPAPQIENQRLAGAGYVWVQCRQVMVRPRGLVTRRVQAGQVEEIPRSSTSRTVIPARVALSVRIAMARPTCRSRSRSRPGDVSLHPGIRIPAQHRPGPAEPGSPNVAGPAPDNSRHKVWLRPARRVVCAGGPLGHDALGSWADETAAGLSATGNPSDNLTRRSIAR
jgi:hypothetical protein